MTPHFSEKGNTLKDMILSCTKVNETLTAAMIQDSIAAKHRRRPDEKDVRNMRDFFKLEKKEITVTPTGRTLKIGKWTRKK
jgi:hypothetical protein